jgi:hypothetical protein
MLPTAVGIAEHLGWAWFVSVAIRAGEPVLLDSRRVQLVAPGLPCMPFHHDTDGMDLQAADALLADVKASAAEYALAGLQSLRKEHAITAISLRHPPLPSLPDSVADSRASYTINCRGDGMLYHQAICGAAERLGIRIALHKRGEEEMLAARSLGVDTGTLKRGLADLGATAPSWTKEHRQAAAAAIAALGHADK